MYINAAGRTDIGLVRGNNEDAFHIDTDRGFFIVCDGVGGNNAGEVASSKTVELLAAFFEEEAEFLDDCRKGKIADADIFVFISDAVREVSRQINEISRENSEHSNMATTMTMAIDMGARILIAHVGDSRAYLINTTGAHQLTEDHTLIREFIRKGLTRQEDAASYLKNILTRSIGKEVTVDVDCLMVSVTEGDRIVLCTDGVSNYLNKSEELLAAISGETPEEQTESLIKFALRNRGLDNATSIVLEICDNESGSGFELMAESTIMEILGECEVFRKLNYRQLSRLRSYMEVVCLEKGEELLSACEKYSGFYLILDGGIIDSDELLIRGESFGLKALYIDHFSATAKTAARQTRLISLDRRRFHHFSQRYPLIACKIHINIVNSLISR